MNVLIVEDEQKIAAFVTQGLTAVGFTVTHCADGELGWQALRDGHFDAAVLDVMLPSISGLEILSRARKAGLLTPVMMLSAKGDLGDRLAGFNNGADDYLPKPFYTEELLARLKALVARQSKDDLVAKLVSVGDLRLDRVTREAVWAGKRILLTPREFGLLDCLMRSPGHVFSRKQILEQVWKISFDPQTNVVDVCVKRLKQKLFGDGESMITSVRGVGYFISETTPGAV